MDLENRNLCWAFSAKISVWTGQNVLYERQTSASQTGSNSAKAKVRSRTLGHLQIEKVGKEQWWATTSLKPPYPNNFWTNFLFLHAHWRGENLSPPPLTYSSGISKKTAMHSDTVFGIPAYNLTTHLVCKFYLPRSILSYIRSYINFQCLFCKQIEI